MSGPIFAEPAPRLFGAPPGAPFAAALAAGVAARLERQPPEALARVEIVVNTERTARAVAEAFEARAAGAGAVFLPRIETIGRFLARRGAAAPPAIGRLERRLALGRLVAAMLARAPSLGPLSAADGLATSLAALLDELHAEGVPLSALPEAVEPEFAAHWGRALDFLSILREAWPDYLAGIGRVDPEARRAALTAATLADWAARPPAHPVIAAGSTGSTRATADLLAAIAGLPQGAVLLPGFDFGLDGAGWDAVGEDHPQCGFRRLAARLKIAPDGVRRWAEAGAGGPRARLMTEALRPAPATAAWRAAAPALDADLDRALAGVTLIEAPSPGREAEAIAVLMRAGLEEGAGRIALVTPDRDLARRVTAALGRWGLIPDESAGRPLALSPPGVFLRMIAEVLTGPFDPARLLAALKHPLAGAGPGRGALAREAARLEVKGLRHPRRGETLTSLDAILSARIGGDEPLAGPALAAALSRLRPLARAARPLEALIDDHLAAAEGLAGPALWEKEAGQRLFAAMAAFREAAPTHGPATPAAYPGLLAAALAEAGDSPADAAQSDPRLAIWGALEARSQSAETVILAGLNEGSWPAAPPAEPWLNRPMRARLGLPAPERRIGLAAHDFLQAASAPRVVFSRALRAGGDPTTPSRWLTRALTLVEGVRKGAMDDARARGAAWLAEAAALAAPRAAPPAPRPAPSPPVAARPRGLSVTEIETLLRDPYAIYARHVLRLRPLEPLGGMADARRRGVVLHDAMERFVAATMDAWPGAEAAARLFDEAADAAIRAAPSAAAAVLWRARLARLRDRFLAEEAARRVAGAPVSVEAKGEVTIPVAGRDFTLKGRADRIDRLRDGRLAIYDYKSGAPPSGAQALVFARQLPLLGAMAAAGAFAGAAGEVARLAYLSLKPDADKAVEVTPEADALDRLAGLVAACDVRPYIARAAPEKTSFVSDYEHLSRFGEWGDKTGEDEA